MSSRIQVSSNSPPIIPDDYYRITGHEMAQQGDKYLHLGDGQWTLVDQEDFGMDTDKFDYLIRPRSKP